MKWKCLSDAVLLIPGKSVPHQNQMHIHARLTLTVMYNHILSASAKHFYKKQLLSWSQEEFCRIELLAPVQKQHWRFENIAYYLYTVWRCV